MVMTDRHIRATFRRYYLHLLLAILVTLVWRLPKGRLLFLGMEYEDSYVYTVVARQILEGNHIGEGAASYLTTVCDVGSLTACESSSTYSGHYIGSSYVFSLAARVLGYWPAIAGLVGIAASCVTVVFIFLIARLLFDSDDIPIFSVAAFAMTPVFAVHGVAAYAEPLSNMCVTIGMFMYLRYVYSPRAERTRIWEISTLCTWSFTLLFAILVKRENLILAFVLPLVSIIRLTAQCDLKTTWRRVGAASLGSGLAVAFSLLLLRFDEVFVNETAEFQRLPFGLTQVRTLLPMFFRSFCVTSWYSLGIVWVLLGLYLIRRYDYRALYPLAAILTYLSLYVSHVRSYYQVNYGDVTPADTLRYSMNFMTMWALLAGVGLASVVRACLSTGWGVRWRMAIVTISLVIYSAAAYRYTTALRGNLTSEEQRARIEPSAVASRFAVALGPVDTYVVTLEPLLVQMYGSPNVNVIALTRFDAQLIEALASQHAYLNFLYVDSAIYRNDIDRLRYRPQLHFLESLERKSLYRNDQFEIFMLRAPSP